LILTKRPRSDRSLISKVKRRLGTSVILAIQEAEIRGIVAQSQPWANSSQNSISKNSSQKTHYKKGLVKWLKV
jgi:hypothetical protein